MNAVVQYQPNLIDAVEVDASSIVPFDEVDTETKIASTISNLKSKMREGYSCLTAVSFGKDSSVLLSLALTALKEVVEEDGTAPFMTVVNSNTGLENPIMDNYSRAEARKVEAYIKKHNLPAQMDIVTPGLSNQYLVQMIGGRTVATMPGQGAKCSEMLKVAPITSHKKQVYKDHGAENVITLIGKRRDESQSRARSMDKNGENAMDAVLDKNASLILSAISDWTLDDIYYYIGMVRSELIDTYSNFDELVQIYRDLNAGDCMINVYAAGKASSTGCGSRSGCFVCTRVGSDRSMENMLEDEQYAWMRGLNDFRNYIAATHYDPSKRTWLPRSVNRDGTVTISPNAYSPAHCEDLLRMILTIQAEEQEISADLGIAPRFSVLSESDILAIDCLWNRYGYQKALKACEIYHDVYVKGRRYPVPTDVTPFPASALGVYGQRVPFADADYLSTYSGFRDLDAAAAGVESTISKSTGEYSWVRTDNTFQIDPESGAMFFEFELDYALNKFDCDLVNPTAAFHYLVRLGVIVINKGGHSEVDRMLRMANVIWRKGLRNVLHDPVALVAKLESYTSTKSLFAPGTQAGLFDELAA